MRGETRRLWAEQDRHDGDRERLFRSVAGHIDAVRVLYPGSWVDVSASFVWPSVTYVDTDRRAGRFFADPEGVAEILGDHDVDPTAHRWSFLAADYTDPLDVPDESCDLLVSLYAGLVSEACTRYLRPGGTLLVNSSHGDVAMASLDDRYELDAVMLSRAGGYVVSETDLEGHLVPKRAVQVTRELIRETGRGIAYTRPAAAYLFRRVG